MKKKLAIKDIAEQLNVSKTTVSFVLNGKAEQNGISKAMQKRVLKHIEKVGYRPNRMAQGLRTGRSKTIGILIEDISDAFFSAVARKFEEVLGKKGYRIVYGSTENDTEVTNELIQVFRNHQVDGFIIAPAPGIEQSVQELLDDKIPVVFFDRPLSELESSCVLVDNFNGTTRAIQHFLNNGYTKTAMITLLSDQSQMKERERGYRICMEESGYKPNLLKLKYHEQKEQAVSDIENYLKENPHIDSIFFATNYLAEAGLEAIVNLKLKVPEELGVIVFDDATLFRLFKPSITAISQPIDGICDQAVQLLLEQLDNEIQGSTRIVQLSTALVIRESTAKR